MNVVNGFLRCVEVNLHFLYYNGRTFTFLHTAWAFEKMTSTKCQPPGLMGGVFVWVLILVLLIPRGGRLGFFSLWRTANSYSSEIWCGDSH